MNYTTNLFCWSMAMSGKHDNYEDGDKIILPSGFLQHVTISNDGIPLFVNLSNQTLDLSTHTGVLEFSASEGNCYVPHWIMSQLVIPEGGTIAVMVTDTFPPAEFIKLKPQSAEAMELLHDPQAILSVKLRKYTCLTQGQWMCVKYLGENIYFDVVETRPTAVVSLINIEATLEFEIPAKKKKRLVVLPAMDAHRGSDKSGVSRETPSRVSKFRHHNSLDKFPGSGRKLN